MLQKKVPQIRGLTYEMKRQFLQAKLRTKETLVGEVMTQVMERGVLLVWKIFHLKENMRVLAQVFPEGG